MTVIDVPRPDSLSTDTFPCSCRTVNATELNPRLHGLVHEQRCRARSLCRALNRSHEPREPFGIDDPRELSVVELHEPTLLEFGSRAAHTFK
jgi:hypothetical protein